MNAISNSAPAMKAPQKSSDPAADAIRRQIASVQKQIKELEGNEKLTPEQKREKKQEFEKQIAELNSQLQQREIQKRAEEADAKAAAMEQLKERNSRGKTAEQAERDISSEMAYGFALSGSHLMASKGANAAYTVAKGEKALADAQAKSPNGCNASAEELAGNETAMDRALRYKGKHLGKASNALGDMTERVGELRQEEAKAEREEERKAALSPEKADENGGATGEQAQAADIAGASAQAVAEQNVQGVQGALSVDKSVEQASADEREKAKNANAIRHVDILL